MTTVAPDRTPASLDALVARHRSEVWRYLRVCGCDEATADDLTQEAFMVVLEKQPVFDGDRAAAAWLRRTARLLALEASRRRSGHELGEDWLDAVDRHFEKLWTAEADWATALRDCVARLDERRRQAVERVYLEGHSLEEVARHLGMKWAGVKTLLQRARENLRNCIARKMGWKLAKPK